MKKPKKRRSDPQKLTVREHISELRARTITILFYIVLFSAAAYFYHDKLIELLTEPLEAPLVFLSPTSGIELALSVSIYTGIVIASPFIIYQAVSFISPSLSKPNSYFVKIILISALLAALGFLFGFKIALPVSLTFLSQFEINNSQFLISSDKYLSFLKLYTLWFAVIFQFPIVLFAFNKIFKLNIRTLLKFELYLIPTAFLIAGIITPTVDILNQTLIALPVVILYQATIVILWLGSTRYSKRK